jgi:hypothetical protein
MGPLLAMTVMLYDPASVAGTGGGGGGALLPPPPQPGITRISIKSESKSKDVRLLPGTPISTIEKNIKLLNASQAVANGRIEGRSIALVPLLVVTVTVEAVVDAIPVVLIEGELNKQAAPAGSPEQARVIVPLNPVEEETATDVEPDNPGAEIITD